MKRFKQILGFDNYYISDSGRVWSNHTDKWLSPDKCMNRYSRIVLCKDGNLKHYYIHRLVLEAFVGPCPDGKECRHLDGNPKNNNLFNLRWGTKKENGNDTQQHKRHIGTNAGIKNGLSKLTEQDVRMIIYMYRTGDFLQKEIAEMYNINQSHVSFIINRKMWKHIWSK